MSQETPLNTNLISAKDMREAIQRSGYLLEQRIEPILAEQGYYVQTNPVFPDPDTGKSREIDISALSARRIYKKGYDFIFPVLLCECENNPQPVVFFTKESPLSFMFHEEIKVSGIPVRFWQKGGYVSLSEFAGMEKFHHYCKGSIATQYCTFHLPKRAKSSWIALHNEEQHDTFNSLLKVLDYEIAQHFDSWYAPERVDEEVNVQVYYPLLILQGSLYSATLKDNRLSLRGLKHVQFRKQLFLTRRNEVETYQIDVITEEYLPAYLRIVDSEVERVRKVFQRKKSDVLISIEKIVDEVKKLKKKPKSYRKYLEL